MNTFENQFVELRELIRTHSKMVDMSGRKSDELINKAEEYLDVVLPKSYRKFLQEYGTLAFGPFEYYGIVDDNFDDSTVPNGIWFTSQERRAVNLPNQLIVISDNEGDQYICLDTSDYDDEGECPVVIWDVITKTVIGKRADNIVNLITQDIRDFIE